MVQMLKHANWRLKTGLIIVVFFLILGFIFPLFNPYDPLDMYVVTADQMPSAKHWLGTTGVGQDTFWLLTASIHNSLIIGICVAVVGTVLGVLVGLVSGFRGGFTDRVLMLITDTFIVIPSLPVLILMASLIKGRISAFFMAAIIVIFAWAWPSRQVRAMALSMREREFINTAWFSGEGTLQVVATEILPYVTNWALSNFINAVLSAIGAEAGLAILGLAPATMPTLGNMIQWSRDYGALLLGKWVWIGSPVISIMVLFIGLFLLMTGYNEFVQARRGR